MQLLTAAELSKIKKSFQRKLVLQVSLSYRHFTQPASLFLEYLGNLASGFEKKFRRSFKLL